MRDYPLVVIAGRVNVGKSTLFNRLIRKPLAITGRIPGITRDALKKVIEHGGKKFYIVDTGGLFPDKEDYHFGAVRRKIEDVVEEADLVLFVVSAKEGITPFDDEMAKWLKKLNKKVLLVVNKIDVKNPEIENFYKLGFDKLIPVSAEHKIGLENLLDEIVKNLPEVEIKYSEKKQDIIRVSILGKPNVGKSSLFNSLIGKDVSVICDEPGTTRDSVDYQTEDFIFVDTAGIKRRFQNEIEYWSYLRSVRSLHYAEICIVVFDVTDKLSKIDKKIAGLVEEEGRGMIFALNKVDLLTATERKRYFEYFNYEMRVFSYVPKVFTSAIKGAGLSTLKVLIKKVWNEWRKKIPSSKLSVKLFPHLKKIKKIKQIAISPPVFEVILKRNEKLQNHEERYIINTLRKEFNFMGSPIKLKVTFSKRRGGYVR